MRLASRAWGSALDPLGRAAQTRILLGWSMIA